MAQRVKSLPAMQEIRLDPWVRKMPWRREWQPTVVLLPGKSHGQRSLGGYSPQGCKELDTTKRLTRSLSQNYYFYATSYLFLDKWVVLGNPATGERKLILSTSLL